MLDQKADGTINRLGIDNVVVVDDQDECAWDHRNFIQ